MDKYTQARIGNVITLIVIVYIIIQVLRNI